MPLLTCLIMPFAGLLAPHHAGVPHSGALTHNSIRRPGGDPRRVSSILALIPSKKPLEVEELEALAGFYQANLCLDDGDRDLSLHLHPSGIVHTTDDAAFSTYTASTQWDCFAVPESSEISLRLQLGNLYLEGKGEREGLRCVVFKGNVLEGRDSPCCVGSFSMSLVLPTIADVGALEERHRARIESRPAPPMSFARDGFVGQWRLMLSVDSDSPPAYFTIGLNADRSFSSVGGEQKLAGMWGVYAKSDGGKWSSIQPAGSSLWLKVEREACSETLKGVADLPVRQSFNLWGRPLLESMEAELAARTPEGTKADRVDGQLWIGNVERAYFGRFSLMRTEGEHFQP